MLTNLIVLTFLNIYAYQIITLYTLPSVICQLDLSRAAVGGDPKTYELSVGIGVVLWASLYNFYATSPLKNPLICCIFKINYTHIYTQILPKQLLQEESPYWILLKTM